MLIAGEHFINHIFNGAFESLVVQINQTLMLSWSSEVYVLQEKKKDQYNKNYTIICMNKKIYIFW
jgi:hypothetical protein